MLFSVWNYEFPKATHKSYLLNGDTTGIEAGQFFIVRDGPKHCTLPLWQPKVTFTHFQMPKLVWAGQASECLPTPEPTISAPSVVPVAMI